MRLYYIEPPNCTNMKDIIGSIFTVRQLEMEFHPYLFVDFLPNNGTHPEGIIFISEKGEKIKKYVDFNDKNTIVDLRDMIWFYLERDYGVKKLREDKFNYEPTFEVLQSWHQKKKGLLKENQKCYNLMIDLLAKKIDSRLVLNDEHRLPTNNVMDRDSCKTTRYGECNDNYPENTALGQRCKMEATWLCDNGYPNKTVQTKNDEILRIRNEIYRELIKNGLNVDKHLYDKIIDAGLFDDVSARMGNKSCNIIEIKNHLGKYFAEKDYITNMIEDFGESGLAPSDGNDITLPFTICVIAIIIMIIFWRIKMYLQ